MKYLRLTDNEYFLLVYLFNLYKNEMETEVLGNDTSDELDVFNSLYNKILKDEEEE